jgi:Raf kinase inhibitor-like YbhB/YbcL family protein
MALELSSRAFSEGQPIPTMYTGDGADISPPLTWSDVPDRTRSFTLICDDPDAPRGNWVHWVAFNIPATQEILPEGLPTAASLLEGTMQGKNDFGNLGYGGPAPPPGKPHRYFFKLYALDITIALAAGARKDQVLAAMKGHVLGEATLMGTYQRHG